jgi:hypothetical protein
MALQELASGGPGRGTEHAEQALTRLPAKALIVCDDGKSQRVTSLFRT